MLNTNRLKRRSQNSAVKVEDLSREVYSPDKNSIQENENVSFGIKVQLVLKNSTCLV